MFRAQVGEGPIYYRRVYFLLFKMSIRFRFSFDQVFPSFLMLCRIVPELRSNFETVHFLNSVRKMTLNTGEMARTKCLQRNKRRPRKPLSERKRKRKKSSGLKGQTPSQTPA